MRKIGIRLLISFIVLAAYAGWRLGTSQDPSSDQSSQVQVGGDFTLTNQFGEQVSSAQFRGKNMLVFFGFTHCPDICPTTLLSLTNVMNALGEDAGEFVPIFISVDPERDTPEVMKAYLASFYKDFVGLTGTKEQVDKVAESYKVYHASERAPGKEADYNVAHSGNVYVMDKEGKYLKFFPPESNEQEMTAYLKSLVAE